MRSGGEQYWKIAMEPSQMMSRGGVALWLNDGSCIRLRPKDQSPAMQSSALISQIFRTLYAPRCIEERIE